MCVASLIGAVVVGMCHRKLDFLLRLTKRFSNAYVFTKAFRRNPQNRPFAYPLINTPFTMSAL
jgi:hypothetical protein